MVASHPSSPDLDPAVVGRRFAAIVIGGSAGGMAATIATLRGLPADFPLPLLVVNHLHPTDDGRYAEHLARSLRLPVAEASDKLAIEPGHVYVAPANYHLLVEWDRSLSLSVDPKVNFSRPSIDVLFESAARVFAGGLISILLTGANDDGAAGMGVVRQLGGLTVAQDPATAEHPVMPQSAIDQGVADLVLPPAEIGELLRRVEAAPTVAGR